MAAKAHIYLSGGTRLVWVLWSQSKHVDVWHPDMLDRPAKALAVGDDLDGEGVIPSFPYRVAHVFADPLAERSDGP